MTTATVSEKSFGPEVLGAAMPVLVEFTASHAPVNAAVDALAGNVKVFKVDVDRNPALKEEYAVRGLPTLILFKHGKPVVRRVGGQLSKAELEEWIDGALILALATRRTSAARAASQFTLANGLKVVVIPDCRLPVVTHLAWYKVGAADELKDFSGLANLVMNLSFKCMHRIPDNNLLQVMARAGGEINGHTGRAATCYWQRVPREELRLAMALEASRMTSLDITEEELATERNVVLEQLRLGIDIEPQARLAEKMLAAAHRAPTYRSPPLELASEIMHLQRSDAVRFHKRHYAPNNVILVVAGDVTPEEVRRLATNIYGNIPANLDIGEKDKAKPGLQPATARIALEDARSTTALFCRSYAVPAYGSAAAGEAEALEVLANILAGGIASRLWRRLIIEDKIATALSGAYSCNAVHGGEIAMSVLANASELQEVEAAVDAAIEDVRENGVSQAELHCAKKTLVANQIYRDGDQLGLASRYARATALGRSIADVEDWPAAVSRVSAAGVQRVAKMHLIAGRSVTGWLSPRRRRRSPATGRSPSERRL